MSGAGRPSSSRRRRTPSPPSSRPYSPRSDTQDRRLWVGVERDNISEVRAAINRGGDPNWANPSFESRTPLHHAAALGREAIGRCLMEEGGARLNATDDNGDTALHRAAISCDLPFVSLLLDAGADSTVKNKREKLPVDLAQQRRGRPNQSKVVELLRRSMSQRPKSAHARRSRPKTASAAAAAARRRRMSAADASFGDLREKPRRTIERREARPTRGIGARRPSRTRMMAAAAHNLEQQHRDRVDEQSGAAGAASSAESEISEVDEIDVPDVFNLSAEADDDLVGANDGEDDDGVDDYDDASWDDDVGGSRSPARAARLSPGPRAAGGSSITPKAWGSPGNGRKAAETAVPAGHERPDSVMEVAAFIAGASGADAEAAEAAAELLYLGTGIANEAQLLSLGEAFLEGPVRAALARAASLSAEAVDAVLRDIRRRRASMDHADVSAAAAAAATSAAEAATRCHGDRPEEQTIARAAAEVAAAAAAVVAALAMPVSSSTQAEDRHAAVAAAAAAAASAAAATAKAARAAAEAVSKASDGMR